MNSKENLPDWAYDMPVAITVCDYEGRIIYMNIASGESFSKSGGEELIGKSLMDCHSEPSRVKLRELLHGENSNIYTIEKNSKKKLICQVPWFQDGIQAGLVEISLAIPAEIPHFIRE